MDEQQIINFRIGQLEDALIATLKGLDIAPIMAASMSEAQPELAQLGVPNSAFTLLTKLKAHLPP